MTEMHAEKLESGELYAHDGATPVTGGTAPTHNPSVFLQTPGCDYLGGGRALLVFLHTAQLEGKVFPVSQGPLWQCPCQAMHIHSELIQDFNHPLQFMSHMWPMGYIALGYL